VVLGGVKREVGVLLKRVKQVSQSIWSRRVTDKREKRNREQTRTRKKREEAETKQDDIKENQKIERKGANYLSNNILLIDFLF
jgi:alkylated DNA nucleotide flippase Atl1